MSQQGPKPNILSLKQQIECIYAAFSRIEDLDLTAAELTNIAIQVLAEKAAVENTGNPNDTSGITERFDFLYRRGLEKIFEKLVEDEADARGRGRE